MAIQTVAGEPLNSFFTLLNNAGTPITGEAFDPASTITRRPDGATFPIAVAEVGQGVYQLVGTTAAGDPPGEWYARVTGTTTGRMFEEIWDVSWGRPAITPVSHDPGPHGVTLREIRRTVADMLADYHTAADVQGGQTNAITDPIGLAWENDRFKGMELLFSNPASPHYERIATVTRSDATTRTLYFEPPLPSATIPGETIELVNFRGRGTTFAQYRSSISAAVAQARQQHALIPHSVTLPAVADRRTPDIAIPDEFVLLSGIETVDRRGLRSVLRANEYRIDGHARVVTLSHRGRDRYHGLPVTLRGYVMPAPVERDDDVTTIDLEWLHNEAKAIILQRMLNAGARMTTQDRIYLQERTAADGKRGMIVTRPAPGSVRLY